MNSFGEVDLDEERFFLCPLLIQNNKTFIAWYYVRTHADLFTLENHNFIRADPSGYAFRRVKFFSCLYCNQAICSLITGIR